MGKHDSYAHFKHITKQAKFKAAAPPQANLDQHKIQPQMPNHKTNANNRYLNGRGH